MTEELKEFLSPFRLYEEPSMYQGLPNVVREDEIVKPTSPPPKPREDETNPDSTQSDQDKKKES